MNKFLAFFVFFKVFITPCYAQLTHAGRGMYVDKFFRTAVNAGGTAIPDQNLSILSVPAKENVLLQYCKENHITYLVLYDLHRVLGNSTFEGYLCSFIEKAKTQYCIEKIGMASSCASIFDYIASSEYSSPMRIASHGKSDFPVKLDILQKDYYPGDSLFLLSEVIRTALFTATFNDNCQYKIDVLVTEYEFWNSGVDDCTGISQTKDQKYVNYQAMITYMDSIRDNYNTTHLNHQLYIETYLGFLNQNTLYAHQTIANWIDGSYNGKQRVDRINTHYFAADPTKAYSRTSAGWNNSGYYLTRFVDFCQAGTNNQTNLHPIFSAECTLWGAGNNFLGSWFNLSVNNNIFTAEKYFYNDWYSDAQTFSPGTVGSPTLGNVVQPGGVQWFAGSYMSGHLNNPVLFTSNSPVCVSSGQNGTFQFQYQGPIEQGLSFKFYLTNAGTSTVLCGTTNPIAWPIYNAATQTSIDLNAALGSCALPAGDYDAHFELTYASECSSCNSACSVYVAPLVRVSVVNTGQIVALTSTSVCQGNPVYLQASSSSGTTSYAWYDGNSAINGATNRNYSPSPTASGTHNYSCLITSSVGTCSANRSNVIPVSINTYPSATLTLQSLNGCTALLQAAPSASTYVWQDGAVGSTYSTTSSGTYSVCVTKNGCSSSASYTYHRASIELVSQTNPCVGAGTTGSVTVNLYWGTAPYSLAWTGPVSGNQSGLAAGNRTINSLPFGTYVFTTTDAVGCSSAISVSVTSKPLPQATASVNSPLCTGDSIYLSANGGISYSWAGPGGFLSTLQSPVIFNPTVSASGTYTVTVTNGYGCSATATASTTITSCPATLNLNLWLQGYYIQNSMQPVLLNQDVAGATPLQTDTIHIELRNGSNPSLVVDSKSAILLIDGKISQPIIFTNATTGNFYWIVVFHRTCVETWSALPVLFDSNNSYDFTHSSSSAFGDNLTELEPGAWGIYTADLNQDGYVTNIDFASYDFDNYYQLGPIYSNTDLDGNGYVMNIDYPFFDLNTFYQIGKVTP